MVYLGASLQLSTIFVRRSRRLALQCFTLMVLSRYRATPMTITLCLSVLPSRWTNYLPRGVPLELKAPRIMVPRLGIRSMEPTTSLRTLGKRASIMIPALKRQRGPTGCDGLGCWTRRLPQWTRTFVPVSGGQPKEWKVPKPLVPTPAAWPFCTSLPLKKTYILGMTGALLGRPVVVTLTVATRPLPLLACRALTGSRELARTIGPERPLSTKSRVEVAQVTALALRRTMKLLKPLQPQPTTPITPV